MNMTEFKAHFDRQVDELKARIAAEVKAEIEEYLAAEAAATHHICIHRYENGTRCWCGAYRTLAQASADREGK